VPKRLLAALAVLTLLAGFVAACGGDDDDSASGGGNIAEFCKNGHSDDPMDVSAESLRADADKADRLAPDEVKDQVSLISDGYRKVADDGGDINAVAALFDDPDIKAASEKITAFCESKGYPQDGSSGDGTGDGGTDEGS
jgi:hypothetical protein